MEYNALMLLYSEEGKDVDMFGVKADMKKN